MGEQMQPDMSIVEGLKRLRVLEKRMDSTAHEIGAYASKLSTEKAAFGSDEKQKQEVARRVQSNIDVAEETLKLKRRVELTNLQVVVTIGSQTRSISDWLLLKRKLGGKIVETFMALSTRTGDARRMEARGFGAGTEGKAVHVERMYDEAEKNKRLRGWQDVLAEIDGRLEVVNATTNLVD